MVLRRRVISVFVVIVLGMIIGISSTATEKVKPSPVAIVIPSIGAYSDLISLGLNPDGSLEVPPLEDPRQAGWYAFGSGPGDNGPAVIVGHVDGRGRLGVFAHLSQVQPGDDIYVFRQSGIPLQFSVDRIDHVQKNAFPTDAVYGSTIDPELRLITCTGRATYGVGYDSNLIVYAKLRK